VRRKGDKYLLTRAENGEPPDERAGVEQLTAARAVVADLVRRYAVLGFECTRLEIQKLAYFAERGSARRPPMKSVDKLLALPRGLAPSEAPGHRLTPQLNGPVTLLSAATDG
jgi:hypothetical protein